MRKRRVGLLAVPRAAVRLAQAGRDPGHRPRAGGGQLGRDGREIERARQRGRVQRPDGQAVVGRRTARPDDRPGRAAGGPRPGRHRPARHGPAAAPGTVARRSRRAGSPAARSGAAGTPRSGLPTSVSAATTWRPVAGSSPQRSRASATRASSTRPSAQLVGVVTDGSRVIVAAPFLALYHFVKAVEVSSSSCRPSGRPRLLGGHLEQVDAVAGHGHDRRRLADRGGEDRVGQRRRPAGPWRPSRDRRRCRPSGAFELSRARTPKSAPSSAWSLSALRWSSSVGWYITWMTCQPKADLTGGRIWPSLSPGARIAFSNSGSTPLVLSKNGSLPPVPVGPWAWASSLSLAGDRVEQARVGLQAGVGGEGLGAGPPPRTGSVSGICAAPDGSPFGRVQDVAHLDRVGGQARLGLADVDLRDLALRRGAREVGDDLALELVVQDVRRERGLVLVEGDAVVDDLGLVRGIDRLGRDVGDPADPEDAVGTLDDRRRRVDLGGEDAPSGNPRRPACRRPRSSRGRRPDRAVEASVETVLATSSQDLPPVQVLQRRVGAWTWRRPSGRRSAATAPRSVDGLDLDDVGVAGLGRRRLGDQPRIDVLGRRADAFLRRELGLELGVDEPLERDGRRAAGAPGRWSASGSCPGPRSGGRPRPRWRSAGRPRRAARRRSPARSLRSSLLIDWPSTLPTDARWSL